MSDERAARLETAAKRYDEAADELERAVAHCRVAAEHFRAGEVPRAGAHAWAAHGHVLAARDALDAQAREHRLRARA
jgi:hypothetical protein